MRQQKLCYAAQAPRSVHCGLIKLLGRRPDFGGRRTGQLQTHVVLLESPSRIRRCWAFKVPAKPAADETGSLYRFAMTNSGPLHGLTKRKTKRDPISTVMSLSLCSDEILVVIKLVDKSVVINLNTLSNVLFQFIQSKSSVSFIIKTFFESLFLFR